MGSRLAAVTVKLSMRNISRSVGPYGHSEGLWAPLSILRNKPEEERMPKSAVGQIRASSWAPSACGGHSRSKHKTHEILQSLRSITSFRACQKFGKSVGLFRKRSGSWSPTVNTELVTSFKVLCVWEPPECGDNAGEAYGELTTTCP